MRECALLCSVYSLSLAHLPGDGSLGGTELGYLTSHRPKRLTATVSRLSDGDRGGGGAAMVSR